MNYLKRLKANYKNWKTFKKMMGKDTEFDRFPSHVFLKYPKDYNFDGKKVMNFGCGKTVFSAPNVLNVDVVPSKGVVVIDQTKPLSQFGKDFDLIIANHVLEHVPNWFEVFKQMAAIIKVGGSIEVWVPPVSSDSAFTYRDHLNRIGMESFYGIGDLMRPGTNLLASTELKDFDDLKRLHVERLSHRLIVTWWTMLAPESLANWMAKHLRNVVSEDEYRFIKL